jgi:tripeptide aminopeptidase
MVATPSHSRRERALADLVKRRLDDLGCLVEEDGTGERIGGDTGNLIARLPGNPSLEPVLFSAHLDRVDNPGRITAVVREGEDRITSDGTTILGADDASGLAAIIDAVRRIRAEGVPHGDVEIVLTVAEEVGLKGSRWLDTSRLRSKLGYVLDCGGPLGVLVNQAPTQKSVLVTIRGLSSHAGMAPEKGISAIRVGAVALASLREGRLSPLSTSNFGVIKGGKATNIVCDLLEIVGEARSHDRSELDAYVAAAAAAFRTAASDAGATAELAWNLEYEAFHVPEGERVLEVAAGALAEIGLEASVVRGGGGLDANNLNLAGIPCVGVSTGYDNVHTPMEEQSISQLVECGRLAATIIRRLGAGL